MKNLFRKHGPIFHISLAAIAFVVVLLLIFSNISRIPGIHAVVTEIKKPTDFSDSGNKTTDESNAFDISTGGDKTTSATTNYDATKNPSILFHSWTSTSETYTVLTLNFLYSADLGSDDTYAVDYSTAGFSDCSDHSTTRTWNTLVSATSASANQVTASTSLSASQDLTQLCVKIHSSKTGSPDNVDVLAYDIWTEGTFTTNTAPVLGHSSDNVLGPASQKTDGSGEVDIKFRVKDADGTTDTSTFLSNSAQYQVGGGGGGFNAIADSSILFSPSNTFIPATDFLGTEYTLTWSSKDQIDGTDSSSVDFRFKINDGDVDSADGTASGFSVDNVAPTLTSVSIESDNANTSLAKVGDSITLGFTASETINTPTVVFQSGGVAVTNTVTYNNPSGNNWVAGYIVDQGDTDGTVTFTIDFTDAVVNSGVQVTAVSDASSVTVDKTVPIVTEVTPVPTPTTDQTPDYTFTTNEAGTISYGGGCESTTSEAILGNNTITFNTLAPGTYSNCTIVVTDTAGNESAALNISSFTIVIEEEEEEEPPPPRRGGSVILPKFIQPQISPPDELVIEINGDEVVPPPTPSPAIPIEPPPLPPPEEVSLPQEVVEVKSKLTAPERRFAVNRQLGNFGFDILYLQIFFNQNGFLLSESGPGSPGNETTYFGPLTQSALIRFQEAYTKEILASWNLSRGTGYLGRTTRAFINDLSSEASP